MKQPEMIRPERGPRVALQLMRDSGVSSLYVADKDMKLQGIVTADDASAALKEGKTIPDVMHREVPRVSPDTLLNDLFELMGETHLPVAVTDERDRLKGIVIKGAVLSALAGNAVPEGGAR
ncbi:Glycine betaine transport ATP-binding protein OpuAA [compost metagenome]